MAVPPKATTVGSGLAGTLLACYLGRSGWAVDLYEKRPDPRRQGAEGGRSINLALSVRGLHALEQIGLAKQVLEDAIAMPGRMIHDRTGHLHSSSPTARTRARPSTPSRATASTSP